MISYTYQLRTCEVPPVTIVLDATPLSVATGGVARYTLELAKALGERFPADSYLLLSDQPLVSGRGLPSNVKLGKPPTGVLNKRWWLWGIQREMRRMRADLFHGTDFSVPYLPLRPSVVTLHDLSVWMGQDWQPSSERVRTRTPALLRLGLATMVITPSESVRRAAIEAFSLPAERVVAVPLAAGEHFRPVAVTGGGTPYFLFVGTLEPRKNITRMIEAWREVRKEADVDLVLAGRLRADFPAPPHEPGLRILGPVAEDDLPGLYSGAAACLYPSLYEGFGLPVLEAMQCGAVVIASRDPAIQEVAGDAAILVDATDTREIARAMEAALQPCPGLRDRALAQARQFSWRRTAEQTHEVYDAAVRAFRE